MKRFAHDKYGRGSAAANGEGFVDLAAGDTFDGLETRLRAQKDLVFVNVFLGLSASIASMRNANELAKHMAVGEAEEAHKFAAKNVGVLFSRGRVGISHFDKKVLPNARWIVTYVRVFSWFDFSGKKKENQEKSNFYSVEAVEINEDTDSERTPRGAMPDGLNPAPFQNLVSQLGGRIAYCVGDVKRTAPSFVGVGRRERRGVLGRGRRAKGRVARRWRAGALFPQWGTPIEALKGNSQRNRNNNENRVDIWRV